MISSYSARPRASAEKFPGEGTTEKIQNYSKKKDRKIALLSLYLLYL